MQNVHFSPPELAHYLGVNESTIKRWVDKGFLKADVTPGGHRRIHKKELERFLKQHPRYAPHSYIARHIDVSVSSDDAERYYDYLFKKDYVRARNDLTRLLLAGAPIEDIVEKIVRPVLIMIGQNWLGKKIDIADEHRMSFMIRAHLVFLETMIPELPPDAPRALLGCPSGEHHEIPLVIISLLLKKYGVQSDILGINVPAADFASEIQKTHPQYVGMSKLFIKNKLEERFSADVGQAAQRVGARVLLGGAGWGDKELSTLKHHARSFHIVTNATELKSAVATTKKRR